MTVCSNLGSTLKFADSSLTAVYNMVVKEYNILEDVYICKYVFIHRRYHIIISNVKWQVDKSYCD